MAFWDFFRRKNKKESAAGWNTFPEIFGQYNTINQSVFSYEIIISAINRITNEIKKLIPIHISRADGNVKVIDSDISATLSDPNSLMCLSSFLEMIIYNYFVKSNSWILPEWDSAGKLLALYPIDPVTVEFIENNNNDIFVNMTFSNGFTATIKYSNVIHLRRNYGKNKFLGVTDNRSLNTLLQMNDDLLKNMNKAISTGSAIQGIIKFSSMLDEDIMQEQVDKLLKNIKTGQSGFLPMDMKSEFQPFQNNKVELVDAETLKFLEDKILADFPISRNIISGNGITKNDIEIFYDQTIEPIIIQMSQEFSRKLLTERQRIGFKQSIIFKHDTRLFINTQDLITISTLLSNTGAVNRSELREFFGLSPLNDDDSKNDFLVMSKNFDSADNISGIDNEVKIQNG